MKSASPVDIHGENLTKHVKQAAERFGSIAKSLGVPPKESPSSKITYAELSIEPYEQSSSSQILSAIRVSNPSVARVIGALEYMDRSMASLRATGLEFLPLLTLFGELSEEDGRKLDLSVAGPAQLLISRSIKDIVRLAQWLDDSCNVIRFVFRHLAMVYAKGSSVGHMVKRDSPHTVLRRLGELYGVLVLVDHCIATNAHLKKAWEAYKTTVYDAKKSQPSEELSSLYQRLDAIDATLFSGATLSLWNDVEQKEASLSVAAVVFQEAEAVLALDPEDTRPDAPAQVLTGLALMDISAQMSRKCGKTMPARGIDAAVAVVKEWPVVHVALGEGWPTLPFVRRMAETCGAAKHPVMKLSMKALLAASAAKLDATKPDEHKTRARTLILRLGRLCKDAERDADAVATCVLALAETAEACQTFVDTLVSTHAIQGSPLKKSVGRCVLDAVHVVHMIGRATHRHRVIIGESLVANIEQRTQNPVFLDALLSRAGPDLVAIAMSLHNGPKTALRRRMFHSTLDLLGSEMKETEVASAREELRAAERVMQVYSHRSALPTSVYMVRTLLETALTDTASYPTLTHVVASFCETLTEIYDAIIPQATHSDLAGSLAEELWHTVDSALLGPLVIRLDDANRKLGKADTVPGIADDVTASAADCTIIRTPSFRLCDRVVNIRAEVLRRVTERMYNHVTCFPADWKVHQEMRMQYKAMGLALYDPHLPLQSKSGGLDVLTIMRHIHSFAANYGYNLNQQFFEQHMAGQQGGKNLNHLRVTDVADSLLQHGAGILDTAVNYTYTYLIATFKLLVEFLRDDQVLSRVGRIGKKYRRLIADVNKEHEKAGEELAHRLETRVPYPFSFADELAKELAAIGAEKEQNPLDNLRELITRMGNGVGYTRLLQSGALHNAGLMSQFILGHGELETPLSKACTKLETTLTKSTVLYRSLVDAFQPVLKQDKRLQSFHLLAPSIIINHVNHVITMKDALGRPGRDAGFCYDGFALGMAFCLSCLSQTGQFDALIWPQAVQDYVDQEFGKDKTAQFTAGRRERFVRENDTFEGVFSSCRMFFETEGME
ncbi:WASH complex subunit 7 [Carpediemonas membranifera]|uniref:WASH complex subunit 7 n=1 Tax=Carpediemonas membranifera TaxID=201153 RepID=A0A8J6BUK2_9EUKA|nr:WASH complex subunit 7 [Carpediemonas membranifera]|eukprot:KAG9390441.1 WASH complex subunit 7 [Carpediemonas membranifera]